MLSLPRRHRATDLSGFGRWIRAPFCSSSWTWLEYVVATGFAAFVAWPAYVPGRRIAGFDSLAYSAPNIAFSAQSWRELRIPQWNDTIFGGVPHLANPQAGVFYPLKFLFLWADAPLTLTLVTVVHLFLLAIGMVFLAHRLGLRAPAGLVASIAMVGSGMAMARSGQFEQFVVVAWTPWLLAATDWLISDPRRTRWSLPATALVVAVILSGAHPQGVFMLIPVIGVWAVARALDARQLRRLCLVPVAGLLGACLAAPQLLPAALFLDEGAQAGGRTLDALRQVGYSLEPRKLPGTVLGSVFTPDQAFLAGSHEAMISIGVGVALLAFLACVMVVTAPRLSCRWTVAGFTGLAVVAGVLSLGPRTVVFRRAYDLIPLFDLARVSARWRDVCVLAASLLAAVAIDAVSRGQVNGRVIVAGGGGILVTAAAIHFSPLGVPDHRSVWAWLVVAGAVLIAIAVPLRIPRGRGVAAVVCALLMIGELAAFTPRNYFRTLSRPAAEVLDSGRAAAFLAAQPGRAMVFTAENFGDPSYIVSALRPNAHTPLGIRSIDGYDGGVQVTRRWTIGVSALASEPAVNTSLTLKAQLRLPLDPALYARFGVAWVLLDRELLDPSVVIAGWTGPEFQDGPLQVWRNPRYQGEAHIYQRTEAAPDSSLSGEFLRGHFAEPSDSALVTPGGTRLDCLRQCQPVAVAVRRRHPGALDLDLSAKAPSLVVVPEQWEEGWRAKVDGRATRVEPADGMFLGVPVPAGRHRIRLAYEAPGLVAGLWIAGITSGLLVLVAFTRIRPR